MSPPGKRRRSQQNFAALHAYFPDAVWDVLCSQDELATSKLEAIVDFSLSLGLRLPTEPTLKMMTSIWMLTSEPSDKLSCMKAGAKHALLMHMKLTFDRARKLRGDPIEFVEVLPTRPAELMHCVSRTPFRLVLGSTSDAFSTMAAGPSR